MIWLADIMRVGSWPFSVITAALCLRACWDKSYHDRGQICRFLGLAVLALGISYGEYHALGKPTNWPTLISCTVGFILSLYGTVSMIHWKHQRPDSSADTVSSGTQPRK